MPKKKYELVPSERKKECNHSHVLPVSYIYIMSIVPYTGLLQCFLCGAYFEHWGLVYQSRRDGRKHT
jgi:hypothetical protein